MFYEKERIESILSCSFCERKFTDTVKIIPDCGKFICGNCYDYLEEEIRGPGRLYRCRACGEDHSLPSYGYPDCKQILNLLKSSPEEKPLSEQARELRTLLKTVEEMMNKLEEFDPKEYIESECERLELHVGEAAEHAIKHIEKIEKELFRQIQNYRQECLESLPNDKQYRSTAVKKEVNELAMEIQDFNKKWKEYFSRINSYATETEIDCAVDQCKMYLEQLKYLEEEVRVHALNGTGMKHNQNDAFLQVRDHLGTLVEMAIKSNKPQPKLRIEFTPSMTLAGHSSDTNQIIFLPDGHLASCSDDQSIKIWNTRSGQEIRTIQGHNDWVTSIVVLPNNLLASGSKDKAIYIWDLKESRLVRTLRGHTKAIVSLKTLKNGNLASYSSDDNIKIWNPYSSQTNLLMTISGHGNGCWVVPLFGVLSTDFLVALSRDAEGKEDCVLRVWSPLDGKLVKSISTELKEVRTVFVLSNDQVATGFKNGAIKIIDCNNNAGGGSRIREKAHDVVISCISQLSNENLVSCGIDEKWSTSIFTIKVWSFSDLSILQTIKTDHAGVIVSIDISADDKYLASVGVDKTIKLWPIVRVQ